LCPLLLLAFKHALHCLRGPCVKQRPVDRTFCLFWLDCFLAVVSLPPRLGFHCTCLFSSVYSRVSLSKKESLVFFFLPTYHLLELQERGKESGMEVDGLYFSGPVFHRFSPLLLPRTFSPTTLSFFSFFFFFFRSSKEAIHPIPEWDRGESTGFFTARYTRNRLLLVVDFNVS
jgi:hypothetical protein